MGNGGTQTNLRIAGGRGAVSPQNGQPDRFWHLRAWNGMNPGGWWRLLVRGRFAIAPRRLGMAAINTVVCPHHTLLWCLQELLYGRRIRATVIRHDPIFVVGHWRSGTTLLHELLALDDRLTYPRTYDCFSPNHFLVSSRWMKWWLRALLPRRRGIDNMALGLDRPQEDEFALCNLGLPSPYLGLAFPNRAELWAEWLDFDGVAPRELERWKRGFVWFLKCLTLRDDKPVVLKSPTHTARIRTLLELFPRARFVHIVRDPYVVFPSTIHLTKTLSRREGLQVPRHEGLEDRVFETFNRLYAAFDRDRPLLSDSQFCEVRYEELVADPVGQMERVYDRLALDDFDHVRPAVERYAHQQRDYPTNRYEISVQTRDEITRRWGWFAERYGYAGWRDRGTERLRE